MSIAEGARRISDVVWEVPTSYKDGMRVPARIYASESLLSEFNEAVYDQITNVATLPGVFKYVLCMPDGHFGYGFPIGGVASMDVENGGVISPGGYRLGHQLRHAPGGEQSF
jgi:tRNA-splicing ligase RtcB